MFRLLRYEQISSTISLLTYRDRQGKACHVLLIKKIKLTTLNTIISKQTKKTQKSLITIVRHIKLTGQSYVFFFFFIHPDKQKIAYIITRRSAEIKFCNQSPLQSILLPNKTKNQNADQQLYSSTFPN